MRNVKEQLVNILNAEVKPALGCTEPVAVALACAKAKELLGEEIVKHSVLVSPNVYKNGMCVGIPGTERLGLKISVALGFIGGHSENGLRVLETLTPEEVKLAEEYMDNTPIDISPANTKEKVYIDPVTGVYNKRYYVEKLSKMDNAAALMFADIKNFKRINENFGHQAGDDVLRQVAGVLRDVAAGKGDVLRYSGDDFVTVFFKATEEELSEIQKEMCRRVEALRFPELPGVQLKLVTAGTSIPGRVEEMLEQVRI